MSRRGYHFEREMEVFFCNLLEQDPVTDFSQRSFRTATSGAAPGSKGDIRVRESKWSPDLTIECKHLNKWSANKGAIFHLYVDWMNKIVEEATSTNSLPMMAWSFKNVMTNRGKGRIQFAMPRAAFDYLWGLVPKINTRGEEFPQFLQLSDVVKYMERKKKYYLVYHDLLWGHAHNPDLITIFLLSQHNWIIVSKVHLEKIMIAIREHYKGNKDGTKI